MLPSSAADAACRSSIRVSSCSLTAEGEPGSVLERVLDEGGEDSDGDRDGNNVIVIYIFLMLT